MKKIMFNDIQTKAVLSGKKTQARRIVPGIISHFRWEVQYKDGTPTVIVGKYKAPSPFCHGEEIAISQRYADIPGLESMEGTRGWSNKMFVKADLMPHVIRITGVKVESLTETSEEDMKEEGVRMNHNGMFTFDGAKKEYINAHRAYYALCEKVYGRGWKNVLVFVYRFKLIR